MFVRILILLLLISVNGFSNNKIPVTIARGFHNIDAEGIVFISVKLFNGEEELLNKEFDALNDSSQISLHDTIPLHGNSNLRYEVTFGNSPLKDGEEITYKKESLEFNLKGNELSLSLYSSFLPKELSRTLRGMYVSTIYNGNELANLVINPNSYYVGNPLSYNIINTSQEVIYGKGSFGNHFWSNVYVYKNDEWIEPKMFKGMCGNIGQQLPLNPGDTANADVQGVIIYSGIYSGLSDHTKLPIGKYKVVSTFTNQPNGILIAESPIVKQIYTYFETSTEFEIK